MDIEPVLYISPYVSRPLEKTNMDLVQFITAGDLDSSLTNSAFRDQIVGFKLDGTYKGCNNDFFADLGRLVVSSRTYRDDYTIGSIIVFNLYFNVKSLDSGAEAYEQQMYEVVMNCVWCQGVQPQILKPDSSFYLAAAEFDEMDTTEFDTREIFSLKNELMDVLCPYRIWVALKRDAGDTAID
jgi:hypothetical protein